MQSINYQTPRPNTLISSLPVDKIEPSPEELQVVDILFKKNSGTVNVIFKEAKESLIVGILFILFSIPQLDDLIKKFIPITSNSIYFLILFKAFVVMLIFWFVKHFYLAKKSI